MLFSCPLVADSPRPHGMQHARLPCRSASPRPCQVHAHCTSDAVQTHHPLLPSPSPTVNLPASGLPMSQLYAPGGQSIGASTSYSFIIFFIIFSVIFHLLSCLLCLPQVKFTFNFGSSALIKRPSQFSRSVVSDSCNPMDCSMPPCPLPIPGVYSNSCPLSQR